MNTIFLMLTFASFALLLIGTIYQANGTGLLSTLVLGFSPSTLESLNLPLHGNYHAGHGEHSAHFHGNAYHGDPWDRAGEGDYLEGDLMGDMEMLGDIDTQEASSIAQGAPISTVLAAKTSNPANAAKIAQMKSQGVLIQSLQIPAVIPVNATVKLAATTRSLSGALVAQNIKRHRTITPFQSIIATTSPNAQGVATVTLDQSLFPQTGENPMIYSIPMFFVTIAASVLNARAGALYTIKLIGATAEFGAQCDDKQWQVERSLATEKMTLRIIPFKRVKDDIKPMLAMIANDEWINNPLSCTLQIEGLAADETVQVVLPGLDSNDLKDFMATYGIKG